MTIQLEHAGVVSPVRLRREARQAAWAVARATFPPRPLTRDWPATHTDMGCTFDLLTRPPFILANAGSERGRLRGVKLALAWLNDQPGDTWQQRWLASGAQPAGRAWKQACIPWLDDHSVQVLQRLDLLSIGLISMICADLVRPSLRWLAGSGVSAWALARNLKKTRDLHGFARLRGACEADQHVSSSARHATVGRAAILVAAKGGALNDVTAGDFLELLDVETQVDGRPHDYSAVSWRPAC